MQAAWDLIVFFVTSQALATWTIVSGIKWPKQPISMEMRLTDCMMDCVYM